MFTAQRILLVAIPLTLLAPMTPAFSADPSQPAEATPTATATSSVTATPTPTASSTVSASPVATASATTPSSPAATASSSTSATASPSPTPVVAATTSAPSQRTPDISITHTFNGAPKKTDQWTKVTEPHVRFDFTVRNNDTRTFTKVNISRRGSFQRPTGPTGCVAPDGTAFAFPSNGMDLPFAFAPGEEFTCFAESTLKPDVVDDTGRWTSIIGLYLWLYFPSLSTDSSPTTLYDGGTAQLLTTNNQERPLGDTGVAAGSPRH